MSYITKPYYRIARPLLTTESESYLFDPDYAQSRNNQIQTAFYLENQIEKLFEYIEPSDESISVFSNKMWQLLVQICMEIESNFKLILSSNGYQKKDTNGHLINRPLDKVNCNIEHDYYKVNQPMKLHLYCVSIQWRKNGNNESLLLHPFESWGTGSYAALTWYQSYNAVKHNRYEKFEDASFINVLNAFAALRVLLYAQFLSISWSRTGIGAMTSSDLNTILTIFDSGPPAEQELYDEADFHNGSLFNVIPLNKTDWDDDEKYRFNWSGFSTDKFAQYNF